MFQILTGEGTFLSTTTSGPGSIAHTISYQMVTTDFPRGLKRPERDAIDSPPSLFRN